MKFILNENKKFILEERFILTEEILLESESQISVDTQDLLGRISNMKTNLSTELKLNILDGSPFADKKAEIEKQVETTRKEIQDLLYGTKKFKDIVGPIHDRAKSKALQSQHGYSTPDIGKLTTCCDTLKRVATSVQQQLSSLKLNKVVYNEKKPEAFTKWVKTFPTNLFTIECSSRI